MMKLLTGVLLGCVAMATATYSASDDVIELTPSNFNKLVTQSGDLWFVEFYAPWCGHCQSLEPEWKKAAKALKGVVNIAAVNADEHNSLGGQFGVRGFPTIKIFGAEKSQPQDYNGGRTAQGIVDSAMSQLKTLVNERLSGKYGGGGGSKSSGGSKNSGGSGNTGGSGGGSDGVIELTDANFDQLVTNSEDMWLVEFFAPWCGHCKNLAPHWESAAAQLSGKVKLGAVDATVHSTIAGRFGVRGYPTIKYFPAGKKDGNGEEYDGGRTSSDIVQWAEERVTVNIPTPEVVQLVDEDAMKIACDDHQLCLVAILPHILDCQSDCRNEYLKVLLQMGEKYKKRIWGWLWAEAGSQPEVEEALGIGGFGYPAMVAINARKMKFSLMKGSFSETGINEYLRELAVGRGSTAPIKNSKLPNISKIEVWDGKDGEMPEEEDIDLSDVDMDDLDDKEEL